MLKRTAVDTQRPAPGARWRRGGPFSRWPRVADAALALVVFVVMIVVSPEGDDELVLRRVDEVAVSALVIAAVASGVLYWRRSRPLLVLGVTMGATALAWAFGEAETVGIAIMFALYSVGRHVANGRWGTVALGVVLAFVTISSLVDAATLAELGFGILFVCFVWYVGRWLRLRGAYAAQLAREHAAEARRAVAEERTRIARELHDVVAHRVSLMTVQAGAAKTVVVSDPEGASQAMDAVEKAGRQALDELRHLLGVLRPDTDGEALGPQPGLADVSGLVDQFRRAGLDVSLTMEGAQIERPARVELSAYRIVQEALTNVLKHAGPDARTEVRVRADARGIAIEVLDNGRAAPAIASSGHGIVGMRERALLLGGSLEVGARPGGGFRVVAHLPTRDGSA